MQRMVPPDLRAILPPATEGLTAGEATRRLARFGANEIVERLETGWTFILRDTARDPMIWFLATTALLFLWLGDRLEALILALALVPIVVMDAYLHRRTQASTEGLAGRLATTAVALRDGQRREIAATQLVPGDLVVVAEGTAFPADGIIVAGSSIQVDESALTGEALPVPKRAFPDDLATAGPTIDGIHLGLAGTRVLTGEASMRVAFTGGETLYGEIVRSARSSRHERTPLQRSIDRLVAILVVAAVAICLGLAVTRLVQGHGLVDALISAVTLAVAALPEEFPVVFAFFLGVGVYRLAGRQALVRRAVVVENIGRVTTICSDKTGTLTQGRLVLAHCSPATGVTEARLLSAAAAAARGASGDPLDIALLSAAGPEQGTVIATYPFTEDRRREVAILDRHGSGLLAVAKGAPETILAMTRLPERDRDAWLASTEAFARTGHKVLASCARRLDAASWSGEEPVDGFDFLGLMAFEDPVRDGAREAVAAARAAGIRVIMVTGDHPATARAIARELGIGGEATRVIDGDELAAILARDGSDGLGDVDVIARTMPARKFDLVQALQKTGEIVAVTGDGVNDVPALRQADIGIAMGLRGTRSAREVASIVLLDDNFRTIVAAIAEGRQLFENLKVSFAYLLMVHMPLVLTAALVPFAGFPLLYLPVHIVWLELIFHPTALLVFQQKAPAGGLSQIGRPAAGRFFSGVEWLVVGLTGATITAATLAAYMRSLGSGYDVAHARSMALAVVVVSSAAAAAGLSRLGTRAAVIAVAATIGSALLLIQFEDLARLVHFSPLHRDDWAIVAVVGLAVASLSALFPALAALGSARGRR